MTLTYKVELEDWLAFNRFYLQNSPVARQQIRRSKWIIMFVLGMTGVATLSSQIQTFDVSVLATILIVVPLMYWVVTKSIGSGVEKQARRGYESDMNKALRQTTTLTITPDHLLTRSSLGESRINWPMVNDISTTAEHIFIQLSANNALIIPKRAFESEEQRQQCIELLEQYHTVVYA